MDGGQLHMPGIPGSEPVEAIPSSEGIPGIPGFEPESPRRRLRTWLELLVAVGLAVLLALLGLGFLINAAGARQHHGASRAVEAVCAVISFGLLALSTRWAIRVEHRLRGQQPVAQAFASAVATSTPKPRPSRFSARRRRHYGPIATGITLALFAGGTIAVSIGAISTYSQGVRSGFVQSHGISASALVESVDNTQHCSRGGCYYTAAILVRLSPPVNGARTTVVHYPDFSELATNETVVVLVDPKQPGYAELPGSRFVASWSWTILAGLAVLFAAVTALAARWLRRLVAHRRDHLAKAASVYAAATP
jgi:hypothetical protein